MNENDEENEASRERRKFATRLYEDSFEPEKESPEVTQLRENYGLIIAILMGFLFITLYFVI